MKRDLAERITRRTKDRSELAHNFVPVVPKQPARADILVKDVKLHY